MNNGKLFDLPPKCPGMLSTKLTSLFGWRHTYRVHHRQKGINHFSQHNLHKTYSLNITPKKQHNTSSSNPSLPETSSMVNSKLSGKSTSSNGLEIPQIQLSLSPDESFFVFVFVSFISCLLIAKDHKQSFHNSVVRAVDFML